MSMHTSEILSLEKDGGKQSKMEVIKYFLSTSKKCLLVL